MKKLTLFLLFLPLGSFLGALDSPEKTVPEHNIFVLDYSFNKINEVFSCPWLQQTLRTNGSGIFQPKATERLSETSINYRAGQIISNSGATQWARTYGGDSTDWAYGIQQTSDGGYIVSGHTQSFGAPFRDSWILKLSSDGAIEWQKSYGGALYNRAYSVQQTIDGGFIVAGYVGNPSSLPNSVLLLKLSSDGSIEWQSIIRGPAGSRADFIQQTSDGGYILAGLIWPGTDPNSYFKDVFVAKLSSVGTIEWRYAYGGPEEESDWNWATQLTTIQQTKDGGYILGCDTMSFGAGGYDIWILKLLSDGTIEWQKTYGGANNEIARNRPSIQQTSDGGYIFAGNTSSFGAGSSDAWVLKLFSEGNIEWQKAYGREGGDAAHAVYETSDGGFIVGGNSNSFSEDGNLDIWFLKLTSDGSIEWQKTYGGEDTDQAFAFQQTSDEGFVAAGYTRSFDAIGDDFFVLKLSPDGEIGPDRGLVKDADALVSDTNISPADTYIVPFNVGVTSQAISLSYYNTNAIEELIAWDLNQPPANVSLQSEMNSSFFKGEKLVNLTWEQDPYNSSFIIEEYKIFRKFPGGEFGVYEEIARVSASTFEYVDSILDPEDFDEEFIYALSSIDSLRNESPKSQPFSTADAENGVYDSKQDSKRGMSASTLASDKNIARVIKETSSPIANGNNPGSIFIREKHISSIQPPEKIFIKRTGDTFLIRWENREGESVDSYNIYIKNDAKDGGGNFQLFRSVPGYVFEVTFYVSDIPFDNTDEKVVFSVTAVNSKGNESQKSKVVRYEEKER